MGKQSFKAELISSSRGSGGHLVTVPGEVVDALGGRGRTPVRATFNGIPYRGSIVKMGGTFCIGVTKAIIAQAGVATGDLLDVVVELDDKPREVDIPADLREPLQADERLKRAWDSLSYTQKREYANWIQDAKREETRRRRVEQTLERLRL
jgi:hypothetical protein